MDLYKEILVNTLAKEEAHVTFPNLNLNAADIVETECYKALQKIKAIIKNDSLDDFSCVEKIVCVLEEFGSNGDSRHDF